MTNYTDETLSRLASAATDRDPIRPPAPLSTNAFWRIVDAKGIFLGYAALLFFVLSIVFQGAGYEWAAYVCIPTIVCLMLNITYLFRKGQHEKATKYLAWQHNQEQARLEIARIVIEQSKNQN